MVFGTCVRGVTKEKAGPCVSEISRDSFEAVWCILLTSK